MALVLERKALQLCNVMSSVKLKWEVDVEDSGAKISKCQSYTVVLAVLDTTFLFNRALLDPTVTLLFPHFCLLLC